MSISIMNKSIGDINERGYLDGMRRRGYTPAKCVLELWANCVDALQKLDVPGVNKKIVARIERAVIKLLDNGVGMDPDSVENMFSMHRANHGSDKSMGVSGIGSKPAMLILSENTLVKVLTRTVGGPYLAIEVPWDRIMRTGIYTGAIEIREMSDDEKTDYINDRVGCDMLVNSEAIGTTIQFKHTDSLHELLKSNFLPVENSSLKDPLDRIHVVFGHCNNIEFHYYDTESSSGKVLPTYNYFGAHTPEYYGGIRTDVIEHLYSSAKNHDRFIHIRGDEAFEITRHGNGYKKHPQKVSVGTPGYTKVGEFTVKTGVRIDDAIFDPSSPYTLKCNGHINAYDLGHFGKDVSDDFLASTAVIRNEQMIGVVPIADRKVSSSRANDIIWHDTLIVRQELEYSPVSSQDNRQDIVIGVQENKNQYNGVAVPLSLTRLLGAIRQEKAQEIRKYYETRKQEMEPVNDESVSENESQTTSTDEDVPVRTVTGVDLSLVFNPSRGYTLEEALAEVHRLYTI